MKYLRLIYYPKKYRLTNRFWRLMLILVIIIISILVLKYTNILKIIPDKFTTSVYWSGVW